MDAEKVEPKDKDVGGTWVAFGKKEYLVPPLNFRAFRELKKDLDALKDFEKLSIDEQLERMDGVSKIIQVALKRNYPDIDLATIEDMLDLGNLKPAMLAVLSVGDASPLVGEAAKVGR